MLRSSLTLSLLAPICAAALAPATASAGDLPTWITPVPTDPVPAANYDPKPGIVYIPFEEITLKANCNGGISSHSSQDSKGCWNPLADETVYPAWGDATSQMALMDALDALLAPYDIVLTNERPEDWISYNMLLMTDGMDAMSENDTCVLVANSNCDGAKRNDIALTVAGTMNCTAPDPVMTAMMAVGRLAGLEGSDNAADPMFSPPDFVTPATAFADACDNLTTDPSQCAHIHKTYCMDDNTKQNSHQELLGVFGPRTEDTTAPVIDSMVPDDGAVYTAMDSPFLPTVMLTEDSNAVAVWFEMLQPDMTSVVKCNNKGLGCSDEWNYLNTPVAGPYDFFNLDPSAAPPGDYVFTFKAQDMYGNLVEEVRTVTFEGAGGDTGTGDAGSADGGSADGGDSGDGGDGGEDTTGDTGDGGGDGGGSSDDGGCSCKTTTTPLGAIAPLGLIALGFIRRRR